MNESLSKKNYAKYDRTFMAFGSIMGALGNAGVVDYKNMKEVTEWAWSSAKQLVSNLVDELYEAENGKQEKAL